MERLACAQGWLGRLPLYGFSSVTLSEKNTQSLGYVLDSVIVKVQVASQEVLFGEWKRPEVALKDILCPT